MLTGSEVFHGASVVALCIAHLHEQPEPPSQRLKRPLPPGLERLILSCLEKEPAQRPGSAAALRQALLACEVTGGDAERQSQIVSNPRAGGIQTSGERGTAPAINEGKDHDQSIQVL